MSFGLNERLPVHIEASQPKCQLDQNAVADLELGRLT